MRISRRRFKPKPAKIIYLLNEKIRYPELRVVDDDDGHLGIMPTPQALELARERELDLVVIQPKAEPPVAKITDFGRYKYEKEKAVRQQKAHSKQVEIKGVRLSLRIGDHDKEVRKKQAVKFLENGDKVKIEIILRGRERRHGDLGSQVIEGFIEELRGEMAIEVDQPVQRQGGRLTSIIRKS